MTATPLAERLRPATLDNVIDQQHLLGPGKPLRVAFESDEPHSMLLWGPPGVGKATLARLMAHGFHAEFISLSAVLSGVRDIREAVKWAQVVRANSGRRAILFVDEVRPFNKAVNCYINQWPGRVVVQIFGLSHASHGGNHG